MDKTAAKVMKLCNNFFAVCCERVKATETEGKAVKADFEGKYKPGMLLRIHGAFTASYGDFGEGELYEVASFEDGTLTLDHPLHTFAPYLFLAYCEPPSDFLELCQDIAAFEEKAANRKGLASESIDGYSWSAATDPNGRDGFMAAFAEELKPYRAPKPTQLYYARNAVPWR